ncbi:MAG: nicotinate-nucleotide--dimethylbenzimidazole phosphoribosyltransferase [Clostridium sp.]
MMELPEILKEITPLNREAMEKAWEHLDGLSKPVRSLGEMEEIVVKMAGITGRLHNTIEKKNIVIFASDNGVCDEGVSGCSQEVTNIVTNNLPRLMSGVGVLSRFYGCDLTVVDVGVKGEITNPKVINRKIREGTRNMHKGFAMTREECILAIETGFETIKNLASEGYKIFGTGEMGIGNTSTSAAVISCLLNLDVEEVVGLGAGLNEGQFENKKRILKEAVELNAPNGEDVIDVLSKVSGFDIAALCGAFLGAASLRVPIVIDGLISCAAALCAFKINPLARDFMFPSHKSAERAVNEVFKALELNPILDMKMRLGEGSGCPMAISIIEASLFMSREMDSFDEAGISENEQENYEKLYEERREYEK